MGKTRPGKDHHYGSASEVAVTPVIGAVLILGISVLGIGGVLFWGAPMIDRMQAQNAQTAIVGEFEELRLSTRELSVPDHSRFPAVVVPRGELSLEPGSRMLVTVNFQSGCDYKITGWSDSDDDWESADTGCSGTDALFKVTGATRVPVPVTDYDGEDKASDWAWVRSIPVADAACPTNRVISGTIGVCAVAWLLSSDQMAWQDTGRDHRVFLDSGAIFSVTSGTQFLEREAFIADTVLGGGETTQPYFGLWLRSLNASSYTSISGEGSHQVYLSLLGNYLRIDDQAYRVRIDVAGPLSEAWCRSLLDRNDRLPDGPDAGTASDFSYASDEDDCAPVGGTTDLRTICYARLASPSDSCDSAAPTPFTVRLLHARIYTSLVI